MRPIRKKNGLTGNAPGVASWTSVAVPRMIVEITTRPATNGVHARPQGHAPRAAVVHVLRQVHWSYAPVSLLIRLKIGMYIAMTMPPTTPPSTAIMIGSSSVSSPATATSTSSS